MADYAGRQISELSGGQQQRLFLARALAQDPQIYLMDEPFAGVDAATERAIVELLQRLRRAGKSVFVVHHDLQTVSSYFDDLLMLNLRVVAHGPVAEVFTDDNPAEDLRRQADAALTGRWTHSAGGPGGPGTERVSYLPSWEQVLRVLLLSDFNTRVVVVGVALLGMAAGIVGTFTLLRKRALVSDAVSHATLPGIAAAWLVMVALGGTGKWFPGLLLGAAAGGLIAVGAVLTLRSVLRLHEDAALGVVLSVSFGIGIALLGLIQQMRRGSAAGLDSFIYGKTASMLSADALLIAVISR